MKKKFESARITANDDGTFNISIEPIRNKDKKGNVVFGEEHRLSASNLQEAISKINEYEASGEDEVSGFMNPHRGMMDDESADAAEDE